MPDAGEMEAALRDISADDNRFPCGRWMSPRRRARIGLGFAAAVCDYHKERGQPCVWSDDE